MVEGVPVALKATAMTAAVWGTAAMAAAEASAVEGQASVSQVETAAARPWVVAG